jgi:hypothetical protein
MAIAVLVFSHMQGAEFLQGKGHEHVNMSRKWDARAAALF